MIKHIIFFQPTPSPHMSPLIAALADFDLNTHVNCFFADNLAITRQSMGWKEGDYGKALVHKSARLSDLQRYSVEHGQPDVFFFSGHLYSKPVKEALMWALQTERKVILISEGLDPVGFKGYLRKLRHLWIDRHIKKQVSAVLCIGPLSIDWHQMIGYNAKFLFPFCYVVDEIKCQPDVVLLPEQCIHLVYAGSLIPLKGVDTLFHALAKIMKNNWRLHIMGDGVEKERLVHIAAVAGFSDKLIWHGMLKNEVLRQQLCLMDCLILPSRAKDGWGAVVNEALSAGCRAIVSSWCGSKELIEDGQNGYVFEAENVESLKERLINILENGSITPIERLQMQSTAYQFSGVSVAAYVYTLLNFLENPSANDTPKPPWKNKALCT